MSSLPARNSSKVADDAPTSVAWDEAFARLECYLRAHHLESRVRLSELVTDIIREVRERVNAAPDEAPVGAAMCVAHARIGAWCERVGNAGDWGDRRVRVWRWCWRIYLRRGWANFSLMKRFLPGPAAALGAGLLQPGPQLRFSNMEAAPLEFGFDDPENPHAPKRNLWMNVRAAAG